VEEQDVEGAPRVTLAQLVDGIGTDQFGFRLISLLHDVCGADHCAAFQIGNESISALVVGSIDPGQSSITYAERYVKEGFWRRDPAIPLAREQLGMATTGMAHLDLNDIRYSALRSRVFPEVHDRVLVCARRDSVDFGLSVVCTNSTKQFATDGIGLLADLCDVLVSAITKHVSVLLHKSSAASALTNLSEIENCILARSVLPRREMEVCARILYGLSSTGIGLDLGVGEESVRTYRKRAYQRLQIGSERELLKWYLSQW
jgi:DNA-binding CsgD family transcriptional regulator